MVLRSEAVCTHDDRRRVRQIRCWYSTNYIAIPLVSLGKSSLNVVSNQIPMARESMPLSRGKTSSVKNHDSNSYMHSVIEHEDIVVSKL